MTAVAKAVGTELDQWGLIPEEQQPTVTNTRGEDVKIVSWMWGDYTNRDHVFKALAWVIRNRVDVGVTYFPDCSTPASCALSPDFQAQRRNPGYTPTEHEKDVARRVLNREETDELGGAVFFHDLTQTPGPEFLDRLTNLEDMDPNVYEALRGPAEAGFYFYSLAQWQAGW